MTVKKSSTRSADLRARMEVVDNWDNRFTANKINMVQFCKKHKLNNQALNHQLAGRRIPMWPMIRKVERAMKKEGI